LHSKKQTAEDQQGIQNVSIDNCFLFEPVFYNRNDKYQTNGHTANCPEGEYQAHKKGEVEQEQNIVKYPGIVIFRHLRMLFFSIAQTRNVLQ
jgi:hypothetical protein